MTTKTPTPQGISRLLAAAGFKRAVSKLRGGVSGFSVSNYGGGPEVEVRYSSITMGEDPASVREGKKTVPDLIREFIAAKGLPYRLTRIKGEGE